MFNTFDVRTQANMEVALERGCSRLPPTHCDHESRKAIAQAILACAKAGNMSLTELTHAAEYAVGQLMQRKSA
ncbi:MAG: hypothetical protein EOO38_18295 [Cytophagaceae bacterium]|nr:MAG: hypothetical protein EOO38_18295 [Cytophagaceae bacterium]